MTRHSQKLVEKIKELGPYPLEVADGIRSPDVAHLRLQAPRPGVHSIPKWIPTTRCLKEMLAWVGYGRVEEIVPPTDSRPIYRAFKD